MKACRELMAMPALNFLGQWRGRHRLLRAALVLALIFSFWTVFLRAPVLIVRGAVITVPGIHGDTIQSAVGNASAGDTIEVSAGVYYENVTIEKSLTLRGEDKYTTIIDAIGRGFNVVEFKQDSTTVSVTISGFTIRNGGSNAGIRATECGGHTIIDNIISGNAIGISLSSTTSGSLIANNTIVQNDIAGFDLLFSSGNSMNNNYISDSIYGIRLDNTCNDNTIADNRIVESSYGIRVENSLNNDVDRNNVSACRLVGIYSLYSDWTAIRNNTVSECAYGIELYGSENNAVSGNTASSNGYGIYLVFSNTNALDSNLASNNDWGIHFYGSQDNTVIQNKVLYNTHGIKLVSSSTGNVIAWNDILDNTQQRYQDGTSAANTWHKSNGTGTYGNYWSDYTGEDNIEPYGVGDTPHGPDQYPLMEPWSTRLNPPVPRFRYSPTLPSAGEEITFDASSSFDLDDDIVSYRWDFDDGNTSWTADLTIAHVYKFPSLYNVTLTAIDSGGLNCSYCQTVLVRMITFISISTSSASAFVGFSVNVTGTLLDMFGNGLGNEVVLLHYASGGVGTWIPVTSDTSDDFGNYHAMWTPAVTGSFVIKAEWAGNSTHAGAYATANLSTLSCEDEYVFSVESNSTVSSLAFNATGSALDFTVSGPPGTSGYVKVTVAKSLVENIADVNVYLDGKQVNYTSTSPDDSWLLHFTYLHSTHNITITFGPISRPSAEIPLGTAVIYTVLPITAIVILVFFILRKKSENKNRLDKKRACMHSIHIFNYSLDSLYSWARIWASRRECAISLIS